jgi:hypothetical protein
MKKSRRVTAFLLVLMVALTILPVTAFAATTYYMFVGQEGTMSMSGNVVPNAKWNTSNSSVLKIVKQSKTSVTTEGMKAGVAKLTVYNSKNTSQKYTYTIKVLKKGKLTKSDFILKERYGTRNVIESLKSISTGVFCPSILIVDEAKLKAYETYRGIRIYDSYSKVCQRYGNNSLKATTTNDYYYRNVASLKNEWKNIWNKQFKYYIDYSYDSHYKMRMYFNGSKTLVGICFAKDRL